MFSIMIIYKLSYLVLDSKYYSASIFFWNSLVISMIQQRLEIWSLVPLPFLKPAWTFGGSQFTYCWSLAWRILSISLTSLVAQMVKRLSTIQESRVWALGWEDPLEKEMAIHSSTIAWKIPWTEEPSRLQSMGSQRVGHDWVTSLSLSLYLYDLYKLVSLLIEKPVLVCVQTCLPYIDCIKTLL